MKSAAFVLLALTLVAAAPEPTYLDRTPSEWAADLASADEAVKGDAIRRLAAGQGDAVPVLLAITRRGPIAPRLAIVYAVRILAEEVGPAAASALSEYPVLRMRADPTVENAKAILPRIDEDPTYDAWEALSLLGEDAVPLILPLLERRLVPPRDYGAGIKALTTLAVLGPRAAAARDTLLSIAEEGPEELRAPALVALASVGSAAAAAVPTLGRIVREAADHRVRGAAFRALAGIGPVSRTEIPAMIGTLAPDGLAPARATALDSFATTRAAAADALAACGPAAKEAIPALTAALADAVPATRIRVAVALVRVGGDPEVACDALLEEARREAPSFLLSTEPVDRPWPGRAAAALGELGASAAPAVPGLVVILEASAPPQDRTDPRREAVWSLAEIGPAARVAAPAVERLVDDRTFGFRASLALWLLDVERDRRMAAMRERVDGGGWWESNLVVEAMELAGPDAVGLFPLLAPTLRRAREEESDRAIGVLERLGSAAAPAVPALVSLLDSPWSCERRRAAQALRAIGAASAPAIPALAATLDAPRPDLRAAASSALERIAATTEDESARSAARGALDAR